eukprot:GEMP01008267.1.p1 GENE.GEMP01008267.1~~GEMP01008267.1.p1  ORF type:complete len:868 (+),score=204.98 GEMP01008267.1:430-3033(+)
MTSRKPGQAVELMKTFKGAFTPQKNPPYWQPRIDVWERLYAKHTAKLAAQPRKPIKITLPDGSVREGTAFETTPMDIANGISKKLANDAVVAKVTYLEQLASLTQCVVADEEESDVEVDEAHQVKDPAVTWDLTRPLEDSCNLELLKFDSPEGQYVFWHSSAHVLGLALETLYGCHLTIGPALEQGFYYDCYLGDKKLSQDNFPEIKAAVAAATKEQQHPFERCVLSKEDALELFKNNPFKVQLITNKVPDGAVTSAYRCGTLIDLCRGPHLPTTGRVKAFDVTKNSSAYWLGKQENDSLQRVYAISFPKDDQMKEYRKMKEEAEKRDHRTLGKQQELFFFHSQVSPGSCFWQPAGARIYNKLIEFMRQEYRIRGFEEVITPNIYSSHLFLTSGHYQNYKDCMYGFDVEGQEWFLKPMNCPGHCMVFDHRVRSYKELPWRMASFGVLHRNELSGTLSGLTRVRRFQQDDAHIFVRPEQIKAEIIACLEFLSYVYGVFGFDYSISLSTRPKKALGSKVLWDEAEAALKDALDEHGHKWTLNPGDGAFYGPKIDIKLMDALKRKHQCGTIQLDFQLPIRFNLQYRTEHDDAKDEKKDDKDDVENVEKNEAGEIIWKEGKLRSGMERPIIIHRAILGSVERFVAILIEHFAGKMAFWLSPRQVMVIPVHEKFNEYANYVATQLHRRGFYANADLSSVTMKKKVLTARRGDQPYYYIAVVGEKDMDALSVTLRSRDQEEILGMFTIVDLFARLEAENMPTSKSLNTLEAFNGRMPTGSAAQGPESPQNVNDDKAQPNRKQGAKNLTQLEVGDCLETFLEVHPYVTGYNPTKADAKLFTQLSSDHAPPTSPNMLRWFDHVASFSVAQRAQWK